MGSKCRDKKKSGGGEKSQGCLKLRCKDKPVASTCQCPRISTSPFPYKEFPPPAPPDGRSDLWDLQFCRWWGWNWVRKRESAIESSAKSEEQRKSSLSSKYRTIDEEACPTKDKCVSEQMPHKSKKLCASSREREAKSARQKQLTPKEQFKVMCKCLLGKKNEPCGMAKLYNTPSASVITFTKQKRISYGVCDKAVEETPEKSPRQSKEDKISEERRCKAKLCSEPKPPTESTTTPCSRQSMTENSEDAPCESLYSNRNESSTEESIEYLTVRLQHITSDSACPCQKHQCPAPKTKEQVVDERNQTEPITVVCPKESKETQTCPAAEKKKVQSTEECVYSEKRIKLKGKKHKTICIMVCCCSACKQNNASDPPKNDSNANESYPSRCGGCQKHETGCSCKKCPKVCWKSDRNLIAKPEKDADNKRSCSNRNFSAIDELAALPLAVTPVNVKKFSKFGTPSKNYPWMQSTESAGTTASLNNMNAINDIYEWLNPDFNEQKPTQTSNLPDLIGITEDLSYLKKLDSSKKTRAEDRILLDAVCDAILQEHDDKTSQYLDEFQLSLDNRNYRELGIVCNMKSDYNLKADVYTELSKALVNQEDIGVQLSKTRNLDELDTMMNNIMNNIFTEPNGNACATKNDTSTVGGQQNLINRDRAFTKTSLMPVFRKTTKRGAAALEPGESEECKKKMKQDDPKLDGVQTSDRIGHIFSKIDDIVQKSKVKTAEIQKVLSFVPKKHDNTSKRNYPMSSDTFKGIICDEVAKQFDHLNTRINDKAPAFDEQDLTEEFEVYSINGDDKDDNVNKKISKLSVHNFIVCDESPAASASAVPPGGQQLMRKRNSCKTSLIPIRKRSNSD